MRRCVTTARLVFLLALINGISAVRICNSSSESWQSRVGILVSPLISGSKIREIDIYWNNVDIADGDKISLFERKNNGTLIETYTVYPHGPSGMEKTGLQLEFRPSSNLSFVEECMGYTVSWQTKKGWQKTSCLKTRPTWMKDRKHILGSLRMSEVFLPGTHDSASYDENGKKTSIIALFAVAQDLDILGQLIHGVRYLDIRVGQYRDTKERFWTNHSPFYRSVPLKTVIDQVKTFLDNTEEIVLMDMREFPIGFDNLSDHKALVSYLEDEFRDYYLANTLGWGVTLNDIWASGKRLIIGYENTAIVESSDSMWPCVSHQWGNVRLVPELSKYLQDIETKDSVSRVRPRAAMAELTPNAKDILLNQLGNLRDMAYRVNLNVTNWYSTVWQYTANIVAVDFVRSTDIVDVAIRSNENRYLFCQ